MPNLKVSRAGRPQDPGENWYALYTRHQHEKSSAALLLRRDFRILLPTYVSVRRWKDRQKILDLPLFPCYVFVHANLLERKLDILTTPGIDSIVGFGGPTPIPDEEIEAIQRVVIANVRAEPCPFLRQGDRVRVKSGPLAGIEGILIRKKSAFRLVLSIQFLAKSICAEVDFADVERVPSTGPPLATSLYTANWPRNLS